MAEYIERETAIKELGNDAPEQVGYSREDAADCIRYMDAADVAPVAHGRWLWYSTTMQECSVCKKHTPRHRYNYCPHCGAKMEK